MYSCVLFSSLRHSSPTAQALAESAAAWGVAPTGWSGGGDCSQVQGVTCDSNGTVVAIDLSNTPLNGSIPKEIGNLTTLTLLLWGTTPSFLSLLTQLRRLDLSDSTLHGSIPGSLWVLPELRHLDLSSNHINSTIPASLGGLKSLTAM
ncbi:unnamed protein product [Closterium sp. Yama58-4]|nr:unnamed protein product [Closterium sp. Yama58-4]